MRNGSAQARRARHAPGCRCLPHFGGGSSAAPLVGGWGGPLRPARGPAACTDGHSQREPGMPGPPVARPLWAQRQLAGARPASAARPPARAWREGPRCLSLSECHRHVRVPTQCQPPWQEQRRDHRLCFLTPPSALLQLLRCRCGVRAKPQASTTSMWSFHAGSIISYPTPTPTPRPHNTRAHAHKHSRA